MFKASSESRQLPVALTSVWRLIGLSLFPRLLTHKCLRSYQAAISNTSSLSSSGKIGLLTHFLCVAILPDLLNVQPLILLHNLSDHLIFKLCSSLEQTGVKTTVRMSFHLINSCCKYMSNLSKPLFIKQESNDRGGIINSFCRLTESFWV